MRKGEDRHEVGAEVFAWLFPPDSQRPGLIRGVALDDDAAVLEASLGPAEGGRWTWCPSDASGNGRRVVLEVHQRRGPGGTATIDQVSARFYASTRLDVDSAWTPVRAHLERHHGAPARDVGQVLKLVWSVEGVGRLSACRYQDERGESVLDLALRR